MLSALHDLALRYKISLIAGLPLVALVCLGVFSVLQFHALHDKAERFDDLVGLSVVANDLAHEVQEERSVSAGFLGSEGKRLRDTVRNQRKLTDEKLARYVARSNDVSSRSDPAMSARLGKTDQALGELTRLRADVDALSIAVPEETSRYKVIVTGLLDIADRLIRYAPSGEVANEGVALAALLRSEERAELERTLLTDVFARDTVSAAEDDELIKLMTMQRVYLDVFSDAADKRYRDLFVERMRDPAIAEVERMRRVIIERGASGEFGIDSQRWFDAATRRIAVFTDIGNALSDSLVDSSAAVVSASAERYRLVTLVIVSVVALSALLAVLIGRSLLGSIRAAVTLAEAISHGDLTVSAPGRRYRDEPGQLLAALDGTRERLQTIIESAQGVAESVQTGSRSIRDDQASLNARTDEQAASVEDTSSSMVEISATTKNNADSAEQADRSAREATERATAGKAVVGDAVVAMDEINRASRQIQNIIGVIDEIAFQTNLLALNAAVEAARAGEQGRGFAVVAGEVRQLAGRSASAAKEIKDLIQDSVHKVEAGADLVDRSGQTLDELVGSISAVSELIGSIAGASREQAIGVDRINDALTRIDDITQQNLAQVRACSSTSERMDREAGELAVQLRFFRVRDTDASLPLTERAAGQTRPAVA